MDPKYQKIPLLFHTSPNLQSIPVWLYLFLLLPLQAPVYSTITYFVWAHYKYLA